MVNCGLGHETTCAVYLTSQAKSEPVFKFKYDPDVQTEKTLNSENTDGLAPNGTNTPDLPATRVLESQATDGLITQASTADGVGVNMAIGGSSAAVELQSTETVCSSGVTFDELTDPNFDIENALISASDKNAVIFLEDTLALIKKTRKRKKPVESRRQIGKKRYLNSDSRWEDDLLTESDSPDETAVYHPSDPSDLRSDVSQGESDRERDYLEAETFSLFKKGKVKEGCKQVYDKSNFCTFCEKEIKSNTT